jgi:UDP-GlcNAc3NAcA epimerase
MAMVNMRAEGLAEERMRLVGDVMYDAALHFGAEAEARSQVLARLGLAKRGYALATIHRAENTDDPARLSVLMDALGRVACELPVVLPLHPRTHKALAEHGWWPAIAERLVVIEPVGYLDMAMLERHARVIATDSGGVQKEAFFYRVPGVVLRDACEWGELIDLGWNRLAPPVSAEAIAETILLQAESPGGAMAAPYGDGRAAQAVVKALCECSRTDASSVGGR